MTAITKERFYTFEEYVVHDDNTDNRYELVNGKLELMNPPTFRHILIAKLIERELDKEISRLELPWLAMREAGIRTGWRKSRIADVYIVTKNQIKNSLDESGILSTPPLLVVEVVSPESVKRDYRYKRSEYAALGVNEYWIVNPLEQQVIVLELDEGLYEETIFNGEQELVSPTFTELKLTPKQIFATEI